MVLFTRWLGGSRIIEPGELLGLLGVILGYLVGRGRFALVPLLDLVGRIAPLVRAGLLVGMGILLMMPGNRVGRGIRR